MALTLADQAILIPCLAIIQNLVKITQPLLVEQSLEDALGEALELDKCARLLGVHEGGGFVTPDNKKHV